MQAEAAVHILGAVMVTVSVASQASAPHLQPHWVCTLPPLDCTYSTMGCSRRSAGDPLSMRSTEASVFVAKNWKIDSMHLAEICREPAEDSGEGAAVE